MEYPKRKLPRLKEYDYSKDGAYFITICTMDRNEILSEIIGCNDGVGRAGSSRHTGISQVIGVLKRMIHKEEGNKIFQDSFYDHIIRDESDYVTRWNYMAENPYKRLEKQEEIN